MSKQIVVFFFARAQLSVGSAYVQVKSKFLTCSNAEHCFYQ
jgi:hypothetical protein